MAYISRRDCAKAVAYALVKGAEYTNAVLDINGPQLMTISEFVEYGNQATGNHVTYQEITDEENYQIFDAMGVPRTTDGQFLKAPRHRFLRMAWLRLHRQSVLEKWMFSQKILKS